MGIENNSYKQSSFGPAFFFLSNRRRKALAVYYEFCRLMDDLADEPQVKNPLEELAGWQQEIRRIFQHVPETELGKQLVQVIDDFGLTEDRFFLLIEGMRADVEGKIYSTLEDLNWYLYRVAVVVGLATLDILGIKGANAQELALLLGNAVQLTNIIRDVPADADMRRVYLPLDLLAQEGLSKEDVLSKCKPERVAAVLALLARQADTYYEKAFKQMKFFPRFKMLPCRMMGCVYAKNLAKIRKKDFLFQTPIKLTKVEKITGVFHALFQTFFM